jgi:hypothetical protein
MKLKNLLRWGLLIVLAAIVIGIVLADYGAGIYLAAGLLLLIPTVLFLQYVKLNKKIVLLLIGGLVILFPLLVLLQGNWVAHSISCGDSSTKTEKEIKSFSAEIYATNFSDGEFAASEKFTYDEVEYKCIGGRWEEGDTKQDIQQVFPNQKVHSTRIGLFTHEVVIPTHTRDYETCCITTSNQIVLKDFPYHSFIDAQYAEDISTDEYLGKETLIWRGYFLDDGIHFAYVPAPFHNVRVFINPFIELSKFDNWILALIGFIVSAVFGAIIKPGVVDWVKAKLKTLFKKEEPAPKIKSPKKKANQNL